MSYIDFAALKEQVSIEQVLSILDLKAKQHGHQWRSACPFCKSGGDRAIVVTPAKKSWYCFSARKGGDIIALAAHVRNVSQREAAQFIAERFGEPQSEPSKPAPASKPEHCCPVLEYLLPEHEAVQKLGIEPATAKDWGIGFAPKGTMRSRVLFPIFDREKTLLAYTGLSENSPRWLFPPNFDPAKAIFASDHAEGELRIMADPLDVVLAWQHSVNAICFLTGSVSIVQLQILVSLLEERGATLIF